MAEYRRVNRKVRGWKTSPRSGRKDGLCCRCRQPIDGAHPAYCKSCYNAWKKERYDADPEKYRESARQWREANPEKAQEAGRRSKLKTAYGLTPEQYEEMSKAQGGRCAACGVVPTYGRGRGLQVDHNHTTGGLRGLLCTKCNQALGLLDENPVKIRNLIEYLARWS